MYPVQGDPLMDGGCGPYFSTKGGLWLATTFTCTDYHWDLLAVAARRLFMEDLDNNKCPRGGKPDRVIKHFIHKCCLSEKQKNNVVLAVFYLAFYVFCIICIL